MHGIFLKKMLSSGPITPITPTRKSANASEAGSILERVRSLRTLFTAIIMVRFTPMMKRDKNIRKVCPAVSFPLSGKEKKGKSKF